MTDKADNPFIANRQIKRTLYNPQQKRENDGYFPWGQSKGGAGDPFRDEHGNVITNRKAAM